MINDIDIDISNIMSDVFWTQSLALNLVEFQVQFLSKILALFQAL